jgi:hypothetical protein
MRINNFYFITLFTLIICTDCSCFENKELIKTFNIEGVTKIDYFYNKIIKNKKFGLLNEFLLDDIEDKALFSSESGEILVWTSGGSKEDFISQTSKLHMKYGDLITYKIINSNYFYYFVPGIHNVEYEIESKYKNVITEEIVILGCLDKGDHKLKLIGYASKVKKTNNDK